MEENNKEENISEKLVKCEKEREEYLAGWQRAKADFVNYKKEELQRFEEIAKYATEDLIKELILVLDNFDLALAVLSNCKEAPTSGGDGVGVPTPKAVGMERGVYMIRAQIADVLRKRGLERIPVKVGEPYDPRVAEAIAEVVSEAPAGTVVEEIESGWRLYGKIIRPARVKISKGQ